MELEHGEALFFPTRIGWRRWLRENSGRTEGVWLLFYKRSAGKSGLLYTDAIDEAICYGWIDGKLRRIDDERHMIRFTPRRKGSVWSKINRDKAKRLISTGQMTAAGLAKIEEAKKNGLWDAAYTNKKKEKMPIDLKNALQEKPGAWKNFQEYANSYRNAYLGWIEAAKTEETRNRRIKVVVERSINKKKPGTE